MKWTSEETLVVISKLEEQITSFNNDLWKVLEEAYENKYDPPAFKITWESSSYLIVYSNGYFY